MSETYIHRIGRTGSANHKGQTISYICEEDYFLLKDIQKHIKMEIAVNKEHPYDIELKGIKAIINSNNAQLTQHRKKKK